MASTTPSHSELSSSPKTQYHQSPGSAKNHESLAETASFDKMDNESQATNSKPQGNRAQVQTPEPRIFNPRLNGQNNNVTDRSPSTPGYLAPFDWDDFEARYEEALANADEDEKQLLTEFEDLIKFFNVWATSASAHDAERGVKRLQTRERYVKIAEQSLSQKKKHLTEVVRAFQSALALLSQN